jgi:hypothetical protein
MNDEWKAACRHQAKAQRYVEVRVSVDDRTILRLDADGCYWRDGDDWALDIPAASRLLASLSSR